MLAVVTVDNDLDLVNGDTSSIAALLLDDGGDGIALREALDAANNTVGADDVNFDGGLTGSTILLGGTQLTVTEGVTITGPGQADLTIDGVTYKDVGVRARGVSAFQAGKKTGKLPLKISMDEFVADRRLMGHRSLALNNGYWDPDQPDVDDAEQTRLAVAAGEIDEATLAGWLRERVTFPTPRYN